MKRIVLAIRSSSNIAADFVVGIKLNSGDYVEKDKNINKDMGHIDLPFQHVREIASWGTIDFIEISGGNYERPG